MFKAYSVVAFGGGLDLGGRETMTMRFLKLVAVVAAPVALLGGCATTHTHARLAYYKVPCNTPGAVIAEPIVLDDPAAPIPAPSTPATPAASPRLCVIAVSDSRSGYAGGYGGYGAYGRGYGRPYFGSVGIGFGFGSHRGSHFGGYRGGHGRRH